MKASQKTLLVVEDDPGLQKALRWAFEDFKVMTAEDRGAERELRRQLMDRLVRVVLCHVSAVFGRERLGRAAVIALATRIKHIGAWC